jgi:mannose-6-phosphate isomerase-like protein (cupin superfamily)
MISYNEFERFALSDYALEQKIVSVIDNLGRQIQIESVSHFLSYTKCTIKIESMEKYNQKFFEYCQTLATKYNHTGPVTCHGFRAYADSPSFPIHKDPDDVLIYVVKGVKTMEIQGKIAQIVAGDSILIPANIPHRAINTHDSLMLSFGLEKFMSDKVDYELDVLSKNN